jgi:hypothetical protein
MKNNLITTAKILLDKISNEGNSTNKGKKITKTSEKNNLSEGFINDFLRKTALNYVSPKSVADAWYEGVLEHLKDKKKKPISTEEGFRQLSVELALGRVHEDLLKLKSGSDVVKTLNDAAKLDKMIKDHFDEIYKKGVDQFLK